MTEAHAEAYDAAGSEARDRIGGEPRPRASAVAGTERVPESLGVTVEATGNAEVDAAVERLTDADALPTHTHIQVYEDVHRGLRDALAALDENRG